MRARLPLVPLRQQKCQRTRYRAGGDVRVERSSSGRWRLRDVISCGKYTCPCCGRRRARTAAEMLGACFEAHRAAYPVGDHWMLTLATPHRREDGAAVSIGWLYDASARFFRSAPWLRFAERFGINARVRAFDATHGGSSGTHPHFHVALFVERAHLPLALVLKHQVEECARSVARERGERRRARKQLRDSGASSTEVRRAEEDDRTWELTATMRLLELQAMQEAPDDGELVALRGLTQAVRRACLRELTAPLLVAWRGALAHVGCGHTVGAHALDLLPAEKAESYFLKWGLAEELALSVEKDRSHLRLLDVVCARLGPQSDAAADLYREFCAVMKGRAWVTGLQDAAKRLGVSKEDAADFSARMRERRDRELERAGRPPLPSVPELRLTVRAQLWSAFLALGHEAVFARIDEAAAAAAVTVDGQAVDDQQVQRDLDALLGDTS